MTGELINSGLTLMLVGMGTVFAFLTVLVIAMTSMSAIVSRLAPPAVTAPPGDDAEIAAVAAAVEHHRRSTRS